MGISFLNPEKRQVMNTETQDCPTPILTILAMPAMVEQQRITMENKKQIRLKGYFFIKFSKRFVLKYHKKA